MSTHSLLWSILVVNQVSSTYINCLPSIWWHCRAWRVAIQQHMTSRDSCLTHIFPLWSPVLKSHGCHESPNWHLWCSLWYYDGHLCLVRSLTVMRCLTSNLPWMRCVWRRQWSHQRRQVLVILQLSKGMTCWNAAQYSSMLVVPCPCHVPHEHKACMENVEYIFYYDILHGNKY